MLNDLAAPTRPPRRSIKRSVTCDGQLFSSQRHLTSIANPSVRWGLLGEAPPIATPILVAWRSSQRASVERTRSGAPVVVLQDGLRGATQFDSEFALEGQMGNDVIIGYDREPGGPGPELPIPRSASSPAGTPRLRRAQGWPVATTRVGRGRHGCGEQDGGHTGREQDGGDTGAAAGWLRNSRGWWRG